MDLYIKQVKLAGHDAETPKQEIYQHYPCPICGSDANLKIIGEVRAGADTSIESAVCVPCEHRFHHKFPRADWLQRYYREKFDNPDNTPPEIIETSALQGHSVYHRMRSRLGRLLRYGMGQEVPNRIHDFMLGLTKADPSYYRKDTSIRRILEIGCGNGTNLLYFKERGYETYGTEVNPGRLRECRNKGLEVYATGIENFDPVASLAPYDFAFSSHVLEHVIDVDNHIRQVAAMIRPHGFLYIETPDQSGESLIYQTHTIYHVQTFSLSSMLRLLAKHGFKAVRVAADGNLQVLAQKQDGPVSPLLSGLVFEDSSLPYLKTMAHHAPDDFIINWDHYHMEIKVLKSGAEIYNSGLRSLKVKSGPNRHELVCRLDSNSADGTVRFIHEGEAPPIWYKIS